MPFVIGEEGIWIYDTFQRCPRTSVRGVRPYKGRRPLLLDTACTKVMALTPPSVLRLERKSRGRVQRNCHY